MQCAKCKTDLNNEEINKKIKCDLCKKQMCQTCSKLSSTEVKVMQLSKKYLKYICPNCNTSDGKIEDEEDSKITISELVKKELRTLKDEMESSISKMKEELILLKESNIELVHLCTSYVGKPMVNNKLQINENTRKETISGNMQVFSSSLLVNNNRETEKRYLQEKTNKSPHIKIHQNVRLQEQSPSAAQKNEQTQDEGTQWNQIVKRKRKTKSQIGIGSTQTDGKQKGFEGREEKSHKKFGCSYPESKTL